MPALIVAIRLVALSLSACVIGTSSGALGASPSPETLKIATYNTHLVPPGVRCLEGVNTDILLAAGLLSVGGGSIHIVANAAIAQSVEVVACLTLVRDIAYDEAKLVSNEIMRRDLDVVALNEVFDEDARERLVSDLSLVYPHRIEYIDKGLRLEDSGLMLFSKFPIAPLPNSSTKFTSGTVRGTTDQVAFVLYPPGACAASDCLAAKGAAYVRLQNTRPNAAFPFYHIVFSHMQADYDGLEEHKDKRDIQSKAVLDLLDTAIGRSALDQHPLFVLGDLNVQGKNALWNNGRDERGDNEWRAFARQNFTFNLLDAWAATTSADDPGVTHPQDGQRLDYVLANTADGRLCVQHMTNADLGNSDHIAVTAEVNLRDHYCDPRRAWEDPPLDTILNSNPPVAWSDTTRIVHPGGVQWFHVKLDDDEFGPLSIGATPQFDPATREGVEIELFAPYDLSVPIPPYSTEILRIQDIMTKKYVLPREFYMRVFSPNPLWTGDYYPIIHRLKCDSELEACPLQVNNPVMFPNVFVANTALDTAWFEVKVTDRADSGDPQQLRFFGRDFASNLLTLELRDRTVPTSPLKLNGQRLTTTPTSQTIAAQEAGPLSLFMTLTRADNTVGSPVRVGWESNLTRLDGLQLAMPGARQEAKLVCDDETDGAFGNEVGEDEIAFYVSVDRKAWRQVIRHDFNCNNGNVSIGLDDQLGVLRFLKDVRFAIIEEDGTFINPDDDPAYLDIMPLPANAFRPSQEVSGARVVYSSDRHSFEGGEYHVEYGLSHQP